jgi:hypothetical protein
MNELKDESQPFLRESATLCPRCRERRPERSDPAARRWKWIAFTAFASNLLLLVVAALVLRVPGRMRCLAQDGTGASLYCTRSDPVYNYELNRRQRHWKNTCAMKKNQATRHSSSRRYTRATHPPSPIKRGLSCTSTVGNYLHARRD